MPTLITGLIVFLGIHSVRIVAPGFRESQLAASEGRWKRVYSLLSVVGLVLIVWGWHIYRPEAPEIYEPPVWGRHLAWPLVFVAFVLFPAANMPAGHIRNRLKHPMLIGTILWAAAHLLANGDLASLLLFGGFLAWAVIDLVAALPRGDPAPVVVRPRSDLISLVAGVVLFALFGLWLHGWLFGVEPFA